MHSEFYDVVYIGNYTKDTITSPTGTRYVDGGGSHYAAYAAARLGKKVAVITHLAAEDAYVVDDLKKAGVDCYPTYTPQSTLMNLHYPTTDPDIRTLTVGGVAGSIAASEIENIQMKAAAINSSLRGEVGLDVFSKLRQRNILLAADVQGFVRVLREQDLKYEPWGEMEEILRHVNVLKSDAVEAEYLTGERDIFKAAQVYAAMGPGEIVLTHKDGVLIYAHGQFHELGFYPARLDGRSGRGDTCIGTYVAMRLTKSPLEAGIWAAAVTSLKMEKLGPFNRPIWEVEAFIRDHYNHGSLR
jgi:sugar/nucleoside kinase (ribokinase family)